MESKVITRKQTQTVITSEALREHWQGHRRLTRKMIAAFPENRLFDYKIGNMRPFAQMVMEMIDMADRGIRGIVSREWPAAGPVGLPDTKKDLLELWDEVTDEINELWPEIPSGRFQEMDVAFGQYEGPVHNFVFYFIDNEIHHRGQAYVYLRSLEIEPPAFWDRQ
jgi:uncharacterized damage-inducible protein DinB